MNIPQVSAVTPSEGVIGSFLAKMGIHGLSRHFGDSTPSEGVVHSRLFDTPSEGVIGSFLAKSGIHGLSRHFGDSTPSEGVAHYGVFLRSA